MPDNDPFDEYEQRPRRRRQRPRDDYGDEYDDSEDDYDDYPPRRRRQSSNSTKIILIVLAVVGGFGVLACGGLLLFGVSRVRDAADRMKSSNNMKMLALALHNYESTHGHFPPPAITSEDGRALLSWRVAILPYVEEEALYQQFRLDEPWDSPNNRPLLDRMPDVFHYPRDDENPNATYYQGIVGPGTMFDPSEKVRISGVKDGSSNTLLIVEAADPVPWSKPEDLTYRPNGPLPSLGLHLHDGKGSNVGFADGSVRFWEAGVVDDATLRAVILRDDGAFPFIP